MRKGASNPLPGLPAQGHRGALPALWGPMDAAQISRFRYFRHGCLGPSWDRGEWLAIPCRGSHTLTQGSWGSAGRPHPSGAEPAGLAARESHRVAKPGPETIPQHPPSQAVPSGPPPPLGPLPCAPSCWPACSGSLLWAHALCTHLGAVSPRGRWFCCGGASRPPSPPSSSPRPVQLSRSGVIFPP